MLDYVKGQYDISRKIDEYEDELLNLFEYAQKEGASEDIVNGFHSQFCAICELKRRLGHMYVK